VDNRQPNTATSVLINITVFTLNVINGTLINNTVNASFQNETGIPFNRSTIINTTVIVPVYVVFNASNISVVKTDSPDPVNTSSTLSYVINVTSNGNGTAYNVTVNDTYPPQVIYQTSNPTPLAGTNNSWVLGNLTPGTSILINITVFTLNVTNGTLINNTVNVSFNNETGALLNRSTTINTTVNVYPQYNFTNITITKTDRPDPVTEDNDLYYQINISSTGNGTAYSLTLTDIYPPEAYYVTALPAPDVGTNNTWSFGTIVQGTNISINITVHVPNGTTGMHINNTANITYQNETGQIVSANATANTTVYTFRYFVETIEHHFIRVRAGAVGRADLFINESYIGFNNTNPDELENITINATVFNLGQGAAANVLVMFWDGINCSGFQIGNYTISPNLQGGRNVTINMTYISIIGNRTISVCVDPFNQIPEQNKSNNNASRTLNVKSTTLYFGSLNGSNITLDNALNITNYDFGFNNSGNIYFFYSGSVFNFTTLQALGRNATGGIATDDFWDADYNLNSTFFNDSVRKLWANWINSTPLATRTFEIYNNTIPFVPIINSTNNSIFVTGILWDTEGDTNGQYDTTNNETLVFVGTINQTYSGIVGLPYDYEIRIATLLRSLKGTLNKTAYIVELQ
jgi:hypothetical protein